MIVAQTGHGCQTFLHLRVSAQFLGQEHRPHHTPHGEERNHGKNAQPTQRHPGRIHHDKGHGRKDHGRAQVRLFQNEEHRNKEEKQDPAQPAPFTVVHPGQTQPPGQDNDQGQLGRFGRLNVEMQNRKPALRTLTHGPYQKHRHKQEQAAGIDRP